MARGVWSLGFQVSLMCDLADSWAFTPLPSFLALAVGGCRVVEWLRQHIIGKQTPQCPWEASRALPQLGNAVLTFLCESLLNVLESQTSHSSISLSLEQVPSPVLQAPLL